MYSMCVYIYMCMCLFCVSSFIEIYQGLNCLLSCNNGVLIFSSIQFTRNRRNLYFP